MSSDSYSHPDLAVQRLQNKGTFTDDEARDIYARAAEIESETLFKNTDLTPEQLERGGNRAGISDAALEAAIKEREAERQRAQQSEKQRAAQKALLTRRALMGGGVLASTLALTLWSANARLGARQQSVKSAQSQVENVLERRYNLVPNLISVTKSTLQNQNALISNLERATQSAKNAPPEAQNQAQTDLKLTIDRTLTELRRENGSSPVVLRLSDEMAGAENRLAVERRKLNQAVETYNRTAAGFPTAWAAKMLGYRVNYPYFQASQAARETPRF